MQINLREFNKKAIANKPVFRRFLSKLRKNPPRGLNTITQQADQEVWKETDCLSCGNCCKTMSPTYTGADIRRIAAHLNMTPAAFRKKMLYKDPGAPNFGGVRFYTYNEGSEKKRKRSGQT